MGKVPSLDLGMEVLLCSLRTYPIRSCRCHTKMIQPLTRGHLDAFLGKGLIWKDFSKNSPYRKMQDFCLIFTLLGLNSVFSSLPLLSLSLFSPSLLSSLFSHPLLEVLKSFLKLMLNKNNEEMENCCHTQARK